MVYLKETRTAPSSAAGEGKAGRGSDGAGEEKKEGGRWGLGGGRLRRRQGRQSDVRVLPLLLLPLVSAHVRGAFQIMMWIDVQQLSPSPGPCPSPRWSPLTAL